MANRITLAPSSFITLNADPDDDRGNNHHNHGPHESDERDNLLLKCNLIITNHKPARNEPQGGKNTVILRRSHHHHQLKSRQLALYCGACCLLMCASLLTLLSWHAQLDHHQHHHHHNLGTDARLGGSAGLEAATGPRQQRDESVTTTAAFFKIEPSGANNVIECEAASGGREEDQDARTNERPTNTLFIVINSRTQNFERRRKLRASWLNAANVRRELCPPSSSSSSSSPPPAGMAGASRAAKPSEGAAMNGWPTINHANRALAHRARIGRVEWLFALGRDQDLDLDGGGHGELGAKIQQERQQFNDLLVLNVTESYRNMTLKHLAILEWLTRGAQERREKIITIKRPVSARPTLGRLLIKCDDDAQLDLAQMIAKYALETTRFSSEPPGEGVAVTRQAEERPLLMCARFEANSPVARAGADQNSKREPPPPPAPPAHAASNHHHHNKWALTRAEWPHDTFPAYCSGLAYLATLELVERLLLVSGLRRRRGKSGGSESSGRDEDTPPLWIDDVYVTGVLLARLPPDQAPRIIKLNAYYCYTRAQRLHRESLEPGLRCMAYEDQEGEEEEGQ